MPAYQGCQQVLRELAEANRLLQTLQQTRCKSLPARAVVGHINTNRGGGQSNQRRISPRGALLRFRRRSWCTYKQTSFHSADKQVYEGGRRDGSGCNTCNPRSKAFLYDSYSSLSQNAFCTCKRISGWCFIFLAFPQIKENLREGYK